MGTDSPECIPALLSPSQSRSLSIGLSGLGCHRFHALSATRRPFSKRESSPKRARLHPDPSVPRSPGSLTCGTGIEYLYPFPNPIQLSPPKEVQQKRQIFDIVKSQLRPIRGQTCPAGLFIHDLDDFRTGDRDVFVYLHYAMQSATK